MPRRSKQMLDDLMPTDPLMAIAWVDCLHWAIGHEPTLTEFREQTGDNLTPARNPFDAMVDKACVVDFEVVRSFVEWFNVNVWGDLSIRSGE